MKWVCEQPSLTTYSALPPSVHTDHVAPSSPPPALAHIALLLPTFGRSLLAPSHQSELLSAELQVFC